MKTFRKVGLLAIFLTFATASFAASPDCSPIASGLVGWWRAEGNTLDTIGTNGGVVVGGLGYAVGEVGQSFAFNGSDSGLRVPAAASLNVGAAGGLTVEMWINPVNASQEQNLVEWNDGSGFIGMHMALSVPWGVGGPGALLANLVDTSGVHHPFTTAPGVILSSVYQHVALTYDKSSGIATLYRNGTVVAQTQIGSITPYTSSDFYVGMRPSGPFTGLVYNGGIDEISIYNRALSASELASIYAAGTSGKCVAQTAPTISSQPQDQTVPIGNSVTFSVIATGTLPLTYQWFKDSTSVPGATASSFTIAQVQPSDAGAYSVAVTNSAGFAISSNATLSISTLTCAPPPSGIVSWWRAEGNTLDTIGANGGVVVGGLGYAVGEVGQSFAFNGSDSGLRVPASASLNVGAAGGLTVEMWINPANASQEQNLVEWNDGSGFIGMHMALSVPWGVGGPGALLANLVDTSGVHHPFTTAPGVILSSVYQHVALTYDKSSGIATLYRNGTVVAQTQIGSITPYTSSDFYVGMRPSGFFTGLVYNGGIDEISIYNRALSASELASIYAAGTSGKCYTPTAPSIVIGPADQTAYAGASVTFSVVATGTSPLSYQWRFSDSDISGATSSMLVLNNATLDQAGVYSVQVTNAYGAVTSAPATLALTNRAPFITTQPHDQSVPVGTSATFSVVAGGSPTLVYQWLFNGSALDAATNSSLTLTNVGPSQDGPYSVVITNFAGAATSSVATLTVTFPPAQLQITSLTASGGHPVVVPITLRANGNENALVASLNFDPSVLTYSGVAAGADASGAALLINDSQVASGRLGIILGLNPGATFNAGTQQVLLITFNTALLVNQTTTFLSFGDQPLARQIDDVNGGALPATYGTGTLVLTPSDIEGDVWPLPAGDRTVGLSDWVTVGRYVARLDYPTNAAEFQRADCAPRATLGDGQITVIDWVQAGRYAARLDPPTVAGGPTSEGAPPRPGVQPRDNSLRQVRVATTNIVENQNASLSVLLDAQGNENALGFSLQFPVTNLTFQTAALGSGATAGTLNINSQRAASGVLGFVLALPYGSHFGTGTVEVLKLTFKASVTPSSATVTLQDDPVVRQVADPAASALATTYLNGLVNVMPLPALTIQGMGSGVLISWPSAATGFVLQTASSPLGSAGWTAVATSPTATNNLNTVQLPLNGSAQYFRLKQQ